jgi:hypothetical protein
VRAQGAARRACSVLRGALIPATQLHTSPPRPPPQPFPFHQEARPQQLTLSLLTLSLVAFSFSFSLLCLVSLACPLYLELAPPAAATTRLPVRRLQTPRTQAQAFKFQYKQLTIAIYSYSA